MRRQRFQPFERVTTTDFNKISLEIFKDIQDGLLRALGGGLAVFIEDGFKATRVNATTVSVAAGRGYAVQTIDDAEEPGYVAFVRDATANVTIAAADATHPRIDLILVARSVTEVTEVRDIRTNPAATVTPTSVVKTRREASAVTVLQGTPAASPTAPTYDTNLFVLLAEVLVTAVTGVGSSGVTDKRRVCYLPRGPIDVRGTTPGAKKFTFNANSAMAADAAVTLPTSSPAANDHVMAFTDAGVGSFKIPAQLHDSPNGPASLGGRGLVPIGGVIATFPHMSGAYNCTNTFVSDGNGWVQCNGQVLSDTDSPLNGQTIPNINNNRFLRGNASSGSTGGSDSVTLTTNEMPSHSHTLSNNTAASSGHTHDMTHVHQILHSVFGDGHYSLNSVATALGTSTFTTGTNITKWTQSSAVQSGAGASPLFVGNTTGAYYSGGAIGSGGAAVTNTGGPSGTTTVGIAANGSGAAFSILPSYITTKYIMRVR